MLLINCRRSSPLLAWGATRCLRRNTHKRLESLQMYNQEVWVLGYGDFESGGVWVLFATDAEIILKALLCEEVIHAFGQSVSKDRHWHHHKGIIGNGVQLAPFASHCAPVESSEHMINKRVIAFLIFIPANLGLLVLMLMNIMQVDLMVKILLWLLRCHLKLVHRYILHYIGHSSTSTFISRTWSGRVSWLIYMFNWSMRTQHLTFTNLERISAIFKWRCLHNFHDSQASSCNEVWMIISVR